MMYRLSHNQWELGQILWIGVIYECSNNLLHFLSRMRTIKSHYNRSKYIFLRFIVLFTFYFLSDDNLYDHLTSEKEGKKDLKETV